MSTYQRLYEINTIVWLWELVAQGVMARPDLAAVPALYIRTWQRWQIDAVWLMGVWERSPYSAQVAQADASLVATFQQALGDYLPADCVGSPYAVRCYDVSELVGGLESLMVFRHQLHKAGIALILDFVPNHTACDHAWLETHPEYYVQGSAEDARRTPGAFFPVHTVDGVKLIAHGRDPYFPPWTDTAQLNYGHLEVHHAMQAELLRIAQWCDGVRCDMAMLCLSDVFSRTWGHLASPPPEAFWPPVIRAVWQQVADFCFIAEVYWQREAELQQLGFNLTYDKECHDALLAGDTQALYSLIAHRGASLAGSLHFLENHDEPRVASRLSPQQEGAAALALLTLPGALLLHEGQIEGFRHHSPVQLRRRRPEPVCDAIQTVYKRLLSLPNLSAGTFHLLHPCPAWQGNQTFLNLLAWAWWGDGQQWLVVINDADVTAQGRLFLVDLSLPADDLLFKDHWQGVAYNRNRNEIQQAGLYIELRPFAAHVFDIQPGPRGAS